MRFNHTGAICCFLVLCIASPCLGAKPAQERRALCGDYSYALPEGFVSFDIPQPYADSVYLRREDGSSPPRFVACIRKKNVGSRDYVLESLDVLQPVPELGGDWLIVLKRLEEHVRGGLRIYYRVLPSQRIKDTDTMPLDDVFVEMDVEDKATHTILYLYDNRPYRKIKKRGQPETEVHLSPEELTARALNFIHSIRKER